MQILFNSAVLVPMGKRIRNLVIALISFVFVLAVSSPVFPRNMDRVVIIKVDGLSRDYVDQWVRTTDPRTGKSMLPWIEEVFYKNGTRIENFYTRGITLSAPSWQLIDTGQHLQIKGNVEYDRFTAETYNYLNIFNFIIDVGLKKKADMPGTEVLDRLNVRLLFDAFPEQKRYISPQLYQRGVNWRHIGSSFANFYPRKPTEFINEWIIGFNYSDVTVDWSEEDIVSKLKSEPGINYLDYYSPGFDHVSHSNRETPARLTALKKIDKTVGRIWTAILSSERAEETGLIMVSDHGINTDEKVYSQGFSLVKLLTGAAGGAHHVTTKRPVMAGYTLKALLPFSLFDTTPSNESYYLKGQSERYPGALLDTDGNERAAVILRENDLNILHILLQQLKDRNVSKDVKSGAAKELFRIIDRRRPDWTNTIAQLGEELPALRRSIQARAEMIRIQKKIPVTPKSGSQDIELIRISAENKKSVKEEERYSQYLATLKAFLALDPNNFDPRKLRIEDYLGSAVMGSVNSVYDLQNYVVGPAEKGLALDSSGNLDLDASFRRVDYSRLFVDQRVTNNVQKGVGNRPVDFVVLSIPYQAISPSLPDEMRSDTDAIWITSGDSKQALILSRTDASGDQILRYVPISNLRQHEKNGRISFQIEDWGSGFPLELFEDLNLKIPPPERALWLSAWHTEAEWFRAIHKTRYSNGVISLNEQILQRQFDPPDRSGGNRADDEKLLRRFRNRQRALTLPDLHVFAKDHWNFDVISFNPGGNHGSFLRTSTNSLLMMAGGKDTGIPRGLAIEGPYDGLSVAPTILALMGRIDGQGEPDAELYQRGFRKFPGQVIIEVIPEEMADRIGLRRSAHILQQKDVAETRTK